MVDLESVEEREVKSKQRSGRQATTGYSDDEDSTDVETVCVECFKFLKALAKDYVEVQQRYFGLVCP